MERATVNGVELGYLVAGEPGSRSAVLIHGYTGNIRNWALTVKPLVAGGWHTLSADNPGHGSSSSPDDAGVYTIPAMADLHHALAMSLGFTPAVVIGHSMGGAIAEEYALRHPEAVSALVLVDSAGGGPREDAQMAAMATMMQQARGIAQEKGMAALWDYQVAAGMRPGIDKLAPELGDYLRSEFALTSVTGYLNCGLGMRDRRNTLPQLGTWRKPALVVRGENEAPGLVQASNGLAAAISGARYEIVPGAAHSPQFENASRFNEILLDFLSRLN